MRGAFTLAYATPTMEPSTKQIRVSVFMVVKWGRSVKARPGRGGGICTGHEDGRPILSYVEPLSMMCSSWALMHNGTLNVARVTQQLGAQVEIKCLEQT